MNLTKLFETQKVLDERIVREKGLEGQDLLPEKILALQVELGELANEWRGFKFWSEDQEPRKRVPILAIGEEIEYFRCVACEGEFDLIEAADIDYKCDIDMNSMMGVRNSSPLLEEYVDCLHFILSIGNDCKFYDGEFYTSHKQDVLEQFKYTFQKASDLGQYKTLGNYEMLMHSFLALGDHFGFAWEQIETAYYAKNQINHERQESGY